MSSLLILIRFANTDPLPSWQANDKVGCNLNANFHWNYRFSISFSLFQRIRIKRAGHLRTRHQFPPWKYSGPNQNRAQSKDSLPFQATWLSIRSQKRPIYQRTDSLAERHFKFWLA